MLLWSMIVLEVMHDAPLLGDGGCTSFSASYSDCPLASVRVHARTDRTHTCTRCKSDVRTRGSLKCGSLRSMCGVCARGRAVTLDCGRVWWSSVETGVRVCSDSATGLSLHGFMYKVFKRTLVCNLYKECHVHVPFCASRFAHWLQPRAPRFATAASLRIQERRGRELTSRAISASHGASSARGHSPEHGAR